LTASLLVHAVDQHHLVLLLQHGAVQGQMLGPTLAPEQQEALMHILMALQQSGEALPPQDLDTVQVSIYCCASLSSGDGTCYPSTLALTDTPLDAMHMI